MPDTKPTSILTVQINKEQSGVYINKTTIRTTQHYAREWTAVDDATYDGPVSPIGFGDTEHEAIDDLAEKTNDRSATSDMARAAPRG